MCCKLQDTMSGVRSHDTFVVKAEVPDLVVPDNENKSLYDIPKLCTKVTKETEWGWYNNILACLLCPIQLVAEFYQNPK